jgi:hypothetical protein
MTRAIATIFASCVLAALSASAAFAQQRTFVSGSGSDSNDCSRIAPCRTFNRAISLTSAGGEVYVLDTAGYGPFAINKSVSVTAPQGVTAGISVFSGDGIDINAAGNDVVVLRGLTVNNQGSTGSGILFNTGGTLHVESCVVNGFASGFAIFSGTGVLEVKDSILRGNATGISVEPPSGTAVATIDRVRLEGNSNAGLTAGGGSQVTVANSTAASNNNVGLRALSRSSSVAELNIEYCVASNNLSGIVAESDSTGIARVRISNSIVTDNTIGLWNIGSPAVLLSRGNNSVEGNANDTLGSISSYAAK